jgi:N-acetylmuramoyl-L-alanine amidase
LYAIVSATPLRRGSRNEAVRVVQRKLGDIGIDAGIPDGIFGKLTTRAVKRYQRANNLKVDGIVGPATWAKLVVKG